MSWGRPKWASIRRPSSARRTICVSVNAGSCWRAGSIVTSCVPPAGEASMATILVATVLGDDLTFSHPVDVGVHQAGDQGLAEAEAGLHARDLSVRRHGVGREENAGRLREDHLLDDHRHLGQPVVEAVLQPVGHGPLGEQRGPAPLHVPGGWPLIPPR